MAKSLLLNLSANIQSLEEVKKTSYKTKSAP